MEKLAFQKGMVVICSAFPRIEIDAEVYWALLGDLPDGNFFIEAAVNIAKSVKEIYPGTNIVAFLREEYWAISKKRLTGKTRFAFPLGSDRWGEPSKEWKDFVRKIAAKKEA